MANTAVFGIYHDRLSTENAVAALMEAGFRNTDISVLFPENVGSKDLGHEKNTKAPEGLATGASSGAVIGGTLGWLVGIGALGGAGRRRSRRRGGRHHRRPDWNGYSGI